MWEGTRLGGPPRLGGEGPDYSWLGLGARVSAGSTCHPPVRDEELEGSSVSPGQGVSDTAAGSAGPVPTACVYLGTAGLWDPWGGRHTHQRLCQKGAQKWVLGSRAVSEPRSAAGGGVYETLFLVGLHVTGGCRQPGRATRGRGDARPWWWVAGSPSKGSGFPSALRSRGRLGHSLEEGTG